MALPPPLPDRSRGLTIAQLILSILGMLLSLAGIILLIFLPLAQTWMGDLDPSQTAQILSIAWIVGLAIALSVPSLVLSIRRLRGLVSRSASPGSFLFASLCLLLIPLLIFFGRQAVEQHAPAWLTAPLNILLVMIPVWWFVTLGMFKLNGGSLQRLWGLSSFSIYLTLPLVFLVEIIVLGFGILAAFFWLIQQPEFAPLLQQIQNQALIDPLAIMNLDFDFLPLIQRPGVIFSAIIGVAVVVPLIEELLKPLGLWFLIKKEPSPAEGFVAGLVCGASFALLESALSLSAAPADNWVVTVAGRAGTSLLHIITAGLNGWALAASWRDGKAIRIGAIYIFTVILHGLWNFFAVLMGIGQVGVEFAVSVDPLLTQSASWVLAGLALLLLIVLVFMNRKLRIAALPPPIPSTAFPPIPPGVME